MIPEISNDLLVIMLGGILIFIVCIVVVLWQNKREKNKGAIEE